jgi:hypothetical protein
MAPGVVCRAIKIDLLPASASIHFLRLKAAFWGQPESPFNHHVIPAAQTEIIQMLHEKRKFRYVGAHKKSDQ